METTETNFWGARDKNGWLWLYWKHKPVKGQYSWKNAYREQTDGFCCCLLPGFILPEVKWKDEEPTELEISIKIKKRSEI